MMMMGNMGGSSGGGMASMGGNMAGGGMANMSGNMAGGGMANMSGNMAGGGMANMGGNMAGGMTNMSGNMQGVDPSMSGMAMNNGAIGINSLFGFVFNLALDIFAVILVLMLIAVVVKYIKEFLANPEGFSFGLRTGYHCKCGQAFQPDWNRCPVCGEVNTHILVAK